MTKYEAMRRRDELLEEKQNLQARLKTIEVLLVQLDRVICPLRRTNRRNGSNGYGMFKGSNS